MGDHIFGLSERVRAGVVVPMLRVESRARVANARLTSNSRLVTHTRYDTTTHIIVDKLSAAISRKTHSYRGRVSG